MFEFGASDNGRFAAVQHRRSAKPGYVSSVRVLEEVSSVVLGDPGAFKAEHSEAEPQLVFFKTTTAKLAQTYALITTKSGREIPLSLVSRGKSDQSEVVDYVLNYERPHSFLITSNHSSFVVGDTQSVASGDPPANPTEVNAAAQQEQQLLKTERLENPHWEGKLLRVAVGQTTEKEQRMAVPFAVLNASARTIEVLPPQIQLAGTSRDKHRKAIKAEPVAIKDYWMTTPGSLPEAGPMDWRCSNGQVSRNPGKDCYWRLPRRRRLIGQSWHRLRLWAPVVGGAK
jgi:hypothetical protein